MTSTCRTTSRTREPTTWEVRGCARTGGVDWSFLFPLIPLSFSFLFIELPNHHHWCIHHHHHWCIHHHHHWCIHHHHHWSLHHHHHSSVLENGKFPFPSTSDLNTRFRRIITGYQRCHKKGMIKLAQVAKVTEGGFLGEVVVIGWWFNSYLSTLLLPTVYLSISSSSHQPHLSTPHSCHCTTLHCRSTPSVSS